MPWSLSSEFLYGSQIPSEKYVIKPLAASGNDRGVYSLVSFWERFKIMTNGIFEGMDWDRVYLLGSILSACAVRNPLEKAFGCHLPKTEDAHFDGDDTDRVRVFWQQHSSGLRDYFNQFYPSKEIISKEVWDKATIKDIFELESCASDLDIAVDFVGDAEFDVVVNRIYSAIKNNVRTSRDLPAKYEFKDNELTLIRIETDKSYKYYVSGIFISRSIEIFRFYGPHPFGGASRFHFAPVRGSISRNGPTVSTSFLCTAMTGQMVDYKWMSSVNNTRDLILKYFMRGYAQVLNLDEHIAIKKQVDKHPEKWSMLSEITDDDRRFTKISDFIYRNTKREVGTWKGLYRMLEELSIDPKKNLCWFTTLPMTKRKRLNPSSNFETAWFGRAGREVDENGTSKKYEDNEVKHMSPMGFNINLRHPSGHIRVLELWQVLAYSSAVIEHE
jgi:hypothetical protein